MGREGRRELALFGGALALRLLWVLDLSRLPFFDWPTSDSLFYASQAARILEGHWLGTELSYPSSPLYPYLLAPFFLLPGRAAFWAIYLFQSALDAAGAVLLRRTAGALFGKVAGWIAGIGWAGYGLAVFYSADLMEAVPAAFLATLFAWLALVRRRPIPAGLCLGAACLLRPHFLPVVAVAAAAFPALAGRRRGLRHAGLFLLAAALPLGLSLTRNLAISGEPVLVSPYGGLNAYLGNHPGATGYLTFPVGKGLRNDVDLRRAAHAYPEARQGRALTETEVSRFWWRETLTGIARVPAAWAGLLLRKARLFWASYEAPNHLDFYFFRQASVPLAMAAVPFGLMAPLGLLGLAAGLAGRIGREGRILAALVLAYAALSILFFVGDRFRLPATGWILLLASWAGSWLIRTLRAGPRGPAAAATAAAVALGAALTVPPPRDHGAREHVLVAASLAGRGRLAEAGRLLAKAVELQPGSAVARFNLGLHLARTGRPAEARRQLERAVEASPEFAAAHAALGDLALRQDPPDPAAAAARYREALRLEPYGREAGRLRGALARLRAGGDLPRGESGRAGGTDP